MLQQTQVKTVRPYWERWMRKLPTIQSAAKASPAKLHKLWEGLGYYTRVRNLQKAAQQIVTQHGGKFPETFGDILALPGVGRYTAGAICSIAFNQPRPILDGNVIRVLTRLFGIATEPRQKKTHTRLWQWAEELVKEASAIHSRNTEHATSSKSRTRTRTKDSDETPCSHLNQSLMELGALICTPRSPNCAACPLQKLCVAFRQKRQEQLPTRGKRVEITDRRFIGFVVERNGKYLVRQRPQGVVNAHLWEFPNAGLGAPEGRTFQSLAHRSAKATPRRSRTDAARHPHVFQIPATKPICTIQHSITRYRIPLEAYRARLVNSRAGSAGQWFTLRQLHRLAFTSAHKKILARLSG